MPAPVFEAMPAPVFRASHPAQRLEPSPPEPEPQAFEGSQAGAEGPPSPEASRSPSRGAYLQSLEPSSRRWVLGGAKPPEEACLGPGAPGSGEPAGEIWYNPIPEEDPRHPAPETPGPQPGLAEPEGVAPQVQVDGVARARTGPLRGGPDFLRLDHTFHLELEAARLLRALVLVWDPCVRRHRPCAQGTVLLPTVFRGCQAQQLAVRLEPQGLLYAKLALTEQREAPHTAEPRVFGLPLRLLVEREQPPGQVPLIIQKCVGQIERRGLRVVGLYRLCGSAAVKKELRDAFERDSAAVCLSEDLYPDINVITGILKDYLRELPTPLITQPLYQVVLEAMARGPPSRAPPSTEGTRGLLSCLPDVERATLTLLLDHLRLVSSFHTHNRMTAQNLAVCFGPVLLPARQDPGRPRSRSSGPGLANTVDFKRHIEVLHYLLQAWPDPPRSPEATDLDPYLRPKQQPPLHLPLAAPEVVTRPRGRGGPESPPSNRYAGDWSVCGRDFLPCGRDFLSGPDYDHVTGSDSEDEEAGEPTGAADFEDDFEAPFNPHLNLKDFDALILDLERELSKQINVCL
ncbi:PREDICTED: rho GTPase-activating protein SYDE1 [Myotis brandtii]|uniref:rho GTPase-activating protein SYDE1 n=1 Tax=Myotis brandtii TaxID=109478 RepID=UPI000704015D|nr:PREDICTED: rho GTPase-activating protein SYDE1 [Myotis brandtii]